MITVNLKTTVKASADELWKLISDFDALPKYLETALTSSVEGEGVGAVRTIDLPDGVILKEKLEELDDAGKRLVYSIVEGPLPIEDYLSTMEVKELGGGKSELTWASKFVANGMPDEEAKSAIEGVYTMGFDGLAKLYG